MGLLNIEYKKNLMYEDVANEIPEVHTNMGVVTSGGIVKLDIYKGDKLIGEVFYDEQTGHFVIPKKYSDIESDDNASVLAGESIRAEYDKYYNPLNHTEDIIKNVLDDIYDGLEIYDEPFYFTFGSSQIENGLNKYVKIIAENMESAEKIMHNSIYSNNYSTSYPEDYFKHSFDASEMHCIDVFSEGKREYLLERKNHKGIQQKFLFDSDELMDYARKIYPEPEEEWHEDEDDEIGCQRINYNMLENGGEKTALEMLEEYEEFKITHLNRTKEQQKLLEYYENNPKFVSEAIMDLVGWDDNLTLDTEYLITTKLSNDQVESLVKRFDILSAPLVKETEVLTKEDQMLKIIGDIKRDIYGDKIPTGKVGNHLLKLEEMIQSNQIVIAKNGAKIEVEYDRNSDQWISSEYGFIGIDKQKVADSEEEAIFMHNDVNYMFVTYEGYTYQPNSESDTPDVENMQVLGTSKGTSSKEAFANLLKENSHLSKMTFDEVHAVETKEKGLQNAEVFSIKSELQDVQKEKTSSNRRSR